MPKDLATNLNFKPKVLKIYGTNVSVDYYHHKACYDAHDYMKNFENIVDPKAGKKNKTKIEYFITWPVSYSQMWMAVPPSGNYSEYEKLTMPFDDFTWALIAFTFVVAFVTVLILFFVPRTIRDFVIGPNVRTPSLNILQIFFGIGMIQLPRRNFSRFLTISFILYCLIIRTAWQGKMFEFMTKDVPKPEIQTIEEMIENGYDFYMEFDFKKMFPESEISKRGKIKSNEETANMTMFNNNKNWLLLLDPSFKGVIAVDEWHALDMLNTTQGRFAKRFRKDLLSTKMCGLGFMKHHHFTGIFDLKSQQMFTAGIVNFRKGVNRDFKTVWLLEMKKFKEPPEPPQVLNLKKLEPGFVIYSSCLLISLLVFVLELQSLLNEYFSRTCEGKHEFRVANLAMNAAKVAISVVPELEDFEIEGEGNVVMKWIDGLESHEDAEAANECEKKDLDIEAQKSSLQAIIRRDSIDNLIEVLEIQPDPINQTRVKAENHVDSIDEVFDDLLQEH